MKERLGCLVFAGITVLGTTALSIWAATTEKGATIGSKTFIIRAYEPDITGRLKGELALSMFGSSDESGQKQYDGLLVQFSDKNPYGIRINLIRGELVPQSFISRSSFR